MIALPRLSGLTVRLRVDMLESRSPASSLLDLAALGLMAGDPAGLPTPPPPATFVGLRPDFGTPDGFDRPLTWAVPTDAGKMADTQSPTSFPSQSADRRGGLLEIDDAAPERQPTFTLPQVAAQMPAPAGDAAPVSESRVIRAPAEPAAEVAAAPLPAFLTLPAPKLPAKEDAPRSDPKIVPQPSSSIFSGPMPTGFVTDIQVQEVDFVTDKVVEADPGEIRYPSQDGKPEWRDANLDGYIFDSGTWNPSTETWDPIEWSVPATVVRNTNPVVSAKFKVMATGNAPPGASHEVTIQGIWHGSGGDGIMLPPVTVPAVGDYVTYPATAAISAVPDYVDSVEWANIEWQFRIQGDMYWYSAGVSSTELFVTLAPPADGPVYHTTVMISTRATAGHYAKDDATVVKDTYDVFKTRTLTTATPAFQLYMTKAERKAGRSLHYYKEWDTENIWQNQLIETGDGQCAAWARFFKGTLKEQRVAGVQVMHIESTQGSKNEWFAVENWDFVGDGKGPNPSYPYRNSVGNDGKHFAKDANNVWSYVWQGNPEVVDEDGEPGQGPTSNPRSIFENHRLVKISGQYYDPSYGTGPWPSLLAWENGSIAAYTTADPTQGFLDFRRNKSGFADPVEVTETVVPL